VSYKLESDGKSRRLTNGPARHEAFLQLCGAATAGELSVDEQVKLNAHLEECPECRDAMSEYEAAATTGVAALAAEFAANERIDSDSSWSADKAEKAFFKRLDNEQGQQSSKHGHHGVGPVKPGQRFTYWPSQIRWQEVWMPFAAAVLLALGIAAYRIGVQRRTGVARTTAISTKGPENSRDEGTSDAGYERAQLMAKLAENARDIDDLKRQLSEQMKVVNALKATDATAPHAAVCRQQTGQTEREAGARRDEELAAAQGKLQELQKTLDAVTAEGEEVKLRAATLEAKVGELTRLVRDREQALDQKQSELARQQELLEHDRDIRELMGARDLYIAEVHDVSRTGTDKTYGRVFYTKGKSLIFYAYDLDARPGLRNASSFQAWGRRGPNKQQALNLGIFYEDNASKKRWVLKAEDPKTLEDIDAVFVTVEPNGGSHHPSGKQLLFAYLRVSPNHP
jgi:hypothetical protein